MGVKGLTTSILLGIIVSVGFMPASFATEEASEVMEAEMAFADSEAAIAEAEDAIKRAEEEERRANEAKAQAKTEISEARAQEAKAKKEIAIAEKKEAVNHKARKVAEKQIQSALQRQEVARRSLEAAERKLKEAQEAKAKAVAQKIAEEQKAQQIETQTKNIVNRTDDMKAEEITILTEVANTKKRVQRLERQFKSAKRTAFKNESEIKENLRLYREDLKAIADKIQKMEEKLTVPRRMASVSGMKTSAKKKRSGWTRVKRKCNVRNAPSFKSKVVGRKKVGERLYVEKLNRKWVAIKTDDGTEYMGSSCFRSARRK